VAVRAFGPGFRRLLAVRLTTQLADGVFEVALASLFFFSPERATTPAGIAAAFAVLTLPFTLVGPWAGVPLDRWSRRNTLMFGNVARAVLAGVVATLAATGVADAALYAVVLAFLSINRFLLAALSASLPHVVAPRDLVVANAVTPTMGTAAYLTGGGLAYGLRLAGLSHPDLVLSSAVILLGAAALTLRLGATQLGPDRDARAATPAAATANPAERRPGRDVARELVEGLRHLRGRRTAARSLAVMTAHRLFFGLASLATILLSRNYFGQGDGTRGLMVLGWVVGAGAVGFVAAAVSTPLWVRRGDPTAVVVVVLAVAGLAVGSFVVTISLPQLLVAAAFIGWSSQSLKICVDTIVQRDVDDGFRGRVFSVYDVLFNAAFVVAVALGALVIPVDGYAPWLFALLGLGYLAASWGYLRAERR
jgi:MFS family permease